MLNQNTLQNILTAGFTIAALSLATSQLYAFPNATRPAQSNRSASASRPAATSRPASTSASRPASQATRPSANQKPATSTTATNRQPATAKPGNTTNINVNKNTNINTNTNVNVNRNTNNSSSARNTNPGRNNGPYVNVYNGTSRNSGSANGRGPGRAGDPRPGNSSFARNHVPDNHFRSSFGRQHEFHLRRVSMVGSAPAFWFGGVSFRMGRPWPMTWMDSDPLYVDNINGAYFLCNRRFPAQMVPVDVTQCDTCTAAAAPQPEECNECVASNNPDPSIPTVTLGMTIGQVVQIQGSPREILDLGARKILLYDNLRMTFLAGRLIDIR